MRPHVTKLPVWGLLILAALITAYPVRADRRDDDKRRYIDFLNKQIGELQDRRKRAEAQLKQVKPEFDKVKDELGPAKQRLDAAIKDASDARAQVVTAQRGVIEAEKSVAEAKAAARGNSAQSADALAAEREYVEAESAFTSLQKSLLVMVHADPEFKSLVQMAVDARARLERRRDEGAAAAELATIVTDLQRYELLVNQMQQKMLSADPRYEKARQRFETAVKARDAIEDRIKETIDKDEAVLAAQKEAAEARVTLNRATKGAAEENSALTGVRADYSEVEGRGRKVAGVMDALNAEIAQVNRLIADREKKKRQAK